MTIMREDLDAGRVELGEIVAELDPVHPGEILLEEFLRPIGMSAYALAKALDVPTNRITGIINGDRAISADTALRLGRYWGTSAEFWMTLQARFDLETEKRAHGDEIEEVVHPRAA